MNRSMPQGVVIPELAYPNVRESVDWLCRTFGFTERLRMGDHRAQVSIGTGSMIVTRRPEHIPSQNETHAVMVRIDDVNAHYERARQAGATINQPPTDYPYGERQYVVTDLGGHRWVFSQTLEDIDPATWGGTLLEKP